ncbi:hypothetical protein DLAC_08406 [Tieghemostelium lacteum]|uniref:DUF4286 family protein n=1 Tax=Tieghemostelium lacteum TaxID=361077 RepID=A0A151ZBX2_TIELA|nr:hypothetical protein DLAC_08406 [Tieghemostelium lacteum]|eukprot:KYQ91438.1 hypothetical protein DLAC_08406 [Tieghemostelium lacteum]
MSNPTTTAAKVIYEVTCEVEDEINERFADWLTKHVDEIVKLENGNLFAKALITKLDNSLVGGQNPSKNTYVMQYYAYSKETLQTYLTKYSAGMREDGLKHFGDKFKATRRSFAIKSEVIPPPSQSNNFGYVF